MIKDATYMRNLANQVNIKHIDTGCVDKHLIDIENSARDGYDALAINNLTSEQISTFTMLGFTVNLASPKGNVHVIGW